MTTVTPSPTKKALTHDIKSAINASNTHRNAIVPEDLNQRLQSIGMRVRKNVTEGYNTNRAATFTVPPTPHCSPVKSPTIQSTPTSVFRTANDALNSVFPAGGSRIPLTPSPKKRARAEVETDASPRRNVDGSTEMDKEEIFDDDSVMVILGPDADSTAFTPPRKIKPLRVRRGIAFPQRKVDDPFVDPLSFPTQASSVDAPSLLAACMDDMQDSMDIVPSEADRETS